jgi:hypothetical protein
MSPEQLIALRKSLSAGTPDAIAVDRILELKSAQQEAEGSAKLIAATNALVASTQRLGTVTRRRDAADGCGGSAGLALQAD